MADPESIYGPPLSLDTPPSTDTSTLPFPVLPRLPPATGSPPPRPANRSASESEWNAGQRHLAGVRKVSEPVPSRAVSPLKEAAPIHGDSVFDFSTPTPPLSFAPHDPFAVPYSKPEEEYDCPSPLSRTVYRSNLVEYDSQDENSPHTMSSATSSDDNDGRRSLDTVPAQVAQGSRITSTVQATKPRPKSILSRLLRQANDDDDFEPVPGPNPRGAQHAISAPAPVAKATKRKSTNPEKWTKRASRKAPPPPINMSPPTDQPLAALGLQLSRQAGNGNDSPRRNIGSFLWRKSEDDRATLDDDDELSWERVRTLPRVCLFPPEEESSEPITLYPPPAPPQLRRPPTLLLARERVPNSSSRSSLYSNTSIGTGSDMWGGMAGGFAKAPPVFKRQPRRGNMVPQGVVMPKKRDQVEKEQEWRMSLINQEMDEFDLAWRSEQSPPMGVQSPPRLARQQSLPQESIPRQSLDEAAPIMPRPQAPLVSPFAKEAPEAPVPRAAYTPPAGIYDRPAPVVSPERSASAPPAIDFGASPPPLVLVAPRTEGQDSVEVPAPAPAADGHNSDPTPRATPVIHERPLSSLERVRQATAAPPPAASRRSSEDSRDSASTASTSRPNKGLRNRRSMSLTSMLSHRQKEEAPPVPIAQPAPKTIKKQRSLKKFFFSSDNLSRDESGSMPPLPKRDKEQDMAVAREKELQRDRVKVIANEMKEREKQFEKDKQREKEREKEEKQRVKDAEKAEGSRRSSRPLLSRPKSKPNLRIDVKATRESTLPSPSLPPMPHSAPMSTASSAASSAYPETPASGSQPSLGGRSAKGSPPAPPSASRGLTKRFSLTNMSGAFRRSRKNLAAAEGPPVPQVPDLPDVYKKEKASKPKPWSLSKHSAPPTSTGHAQALQAAYAAPHVSRTSSVPMPSSSKMIKSSSLPHVDFEGAPGAFLSKEDQKAYLSPPPKPRDLEAGLDSKAPGPASQAIHQPRSSLSSLKRLSHSQISPTGSAFSDSSSTFELEQELDEAQLVLVSPKTRRDPAVSLQTVMGITPGTRMSRFVQSPDEKRKSVEAIVVGPLLVPPTPPKGAVYLPSLAESPSSMEGTVVQRTTLEFHGPEFDELENTPTQSPRDAGLQPGRSYSTDEPPVVGTFRLGPPQSESETSLESLGRSSVSSEPSDLPCVTPASPNSDTLHYPPMALVPDVPAIDMGVSPYQITDLPEVTDSPASQMDVDIDDELVDEHLEAETAEEMAEETHSMPAIVEPSSSAESDLVVVHHSPSFALTTSPIGSPAAASGSTISPRHSSKWSPDAGGLFRFLSGGSEKGSPRSITPSLKRRSGTSPSTSPRLESEPESTPIPSDSNTPNSLGLDLDSTASQLSFPVPPSKPDGFTGGLKETVQLKSLHFDSLRLDFDGFDWSKSALGTQGLGLEGMDEEAVEEVM